MPFQIFYCPVCETKFKTKSSAPTHCEDVACELLIMPPKAKFMEKMDADHGKSRMIGQEKILKERSRHHSRSVEIDDLISVNSLDTAAKNGWIREDGKVAKKIDDL